MESARKTPDAARPAPRPPGGESGPGASSAGVPSAGAPRLPPSLVDRIRLGLQQPAPPKLTGDDSPPPLKRLMPAAVLVPILPTPRPELLLTTRTRSLAKHPGQVAFPGGRIDQNDHGPVAAALREAQEEVGLNPASVEVLGLGDPYRTGTGFEVRPVIGLLPPKIDLRLNPAEVADTFRVPLEYVLDPVNHMIREALWEGRRRRFYVIEWQNRTIWGATAGMLVNLAARLA